MDHTGKIDAAFINKVYRYMKNDMSIETFRSKFNLSETEVNGLVELCNIYGKEVRLEPQGDTIVFKKNTPKISPTKKLDRDSDKLNHNEICVVSDTHFGNNHNQLHLLNDIYQDKNNDNKNDYIKDSIKNIKDIFNIK